MLTALTLAGCATAPVYERPTVRVASTFKEQGPWQRAGTDVPPPGQWWQIFGDPELDALAARIEQGSPSLAAAVARYDQASAQVRRTRADLLPQVGVGADAGRQRVSAGRPLGAGRAVIYSDLSVGASLSYELDLFGRIRNNVRATQADAEASSADVAAVRLALQAQLASTYFDMRGLDARLVLLRETVEAFTRAFELTSTRHEGGIASGIDVSRAGAQLASAKAELDAVAAARARDEHAIAILVGETPSSFSLPVVDRQVAPPAVPVGLPSTLLERRPDIAVAERQVAAANARIGVARAALFPQVTLGGSGGFEATAGSLLSASNGFWALGPLSAALAIFDGGARRAQVRFARAQFDEAAANYRQTVLTAFREVEDDLAAVRHLGEQERNQAEAVRQAQRTRELATTRYRDGASDYLEVVTAQTAALDAERALLILRSDQLQAATDLVRALGGTFPTS
ncbi:efflux transporter outer membrane subunit [Sphingomonas phyllosphaerae]|uniref:efflux transporter outer membrane subunit n=1 Tax=Sphingomonas phyllosphaerae TaxID=257003 RepID=UPI000415BA4E|nr:efflux transporter outer membrane subunit [Sphingomonas phyllosphaerae]